MLNQYRDANWQENYQREVQKDQISKIQRNLNEIVNQMSGEYGAGKRLINTDSNTIEDYNRLLKYVEDEVAEYENRVQTAQDRIALRNSLVTMNENAARKKGQMIYLLQTFLFTMLFLIPAFVAFLAGSLSAEGLFGTFLFLVVLYFLYVYYEIYYSKGADGRGGLFSDIRSEVHKIDESLLKFGRELEREGKQSLRKTCGFSPSGLSQWQIGGRGYVPVMSTTK
jgi:hypothetical protein